MAAIYRTISIGGATYDLFLALPESTSTKDNVQFTIGDKIPVSSVEETCGGGAGNTSVALKRLGFAASFSGVVGGDQWGERLLSNLTNEGVDISGATIIEHETSSFSVILLLPNGERTILYHRGASDRLEDVTFDRDALLNADIVYLNHLNDRSCMIEDDIIMMLEKNAHAFLAWNPGGCQIANGMHASVTEKLLKRTQLLLLNKEEAKQFTGKTETGDVLATLRAADVQTVCITDGANGTMAANNEGMYFCPACTNISIVDTTGAGDAFGTGALWGLFHAKTLPEALIAGTLNASSVVQKMGAQAGLLTETEIQLLCSTHSLNARRLD